MRYQTRCVCGHLSAFEIIPMPVVPSHRDKKVSDEPTSLHNANARLLAVAVAAKNAAVRLELIQKAGPLGQSPKWTQDLLDALAAVEDLL